MLASWPGQNNHCLVLAIIPLMLWCAECNASSNLALNCYGIRILSPFMGTSSRQYNWSAISQNWWIFGSSLWYDFENQSWIYVASIWHFSLAAVAAAILILSQVMVRNLGSWAYVALIDACIFRSICWMVLMVVALLCSNNVRCLEVQSGIVLSFPGMCFIWNLYINDLSLKSNRRGFFMVSRIWSENIFISDWASQYKHPAGF